MELETIVDETFGSRYAPTTLKSQDTGVKHWIIFVNKVVFHDSVYLFTLQDLPPSNAKAREAEHRLLMFAAYLSKSYTPGTVGEYVSHVKARHFFWLHFHDFAEYGVMFSRIKVFLRILRNRNPRQLRKKLPFTKPLLAKTWQAIRHDFVSLKFGAMVFWAVSTMAFQQLMRLNELVTMRVKTQANLYPIMIAHLTFFDRQGMQIEFPASLSDAQSRLARLAYAVVLAPPSKADPTASNDPFYLPMSVGSAMSLAPCWVLWMFMAAYPVRPMARAATPLFRTAPQAYAGQVQEYGFDVAFKAACRAANIRYEGFGKHRYRVGGLNALQDAGCSVAQVMAAGHWKSDAWLVYSRRQRISLMHYSNMMLR